MFGARGIFTFAGPLLCSPRTLIVHTAQTIDIAQFIELLRGMALDKAIVIKTVANEFARPFGDCRRPYERPSVFETFYWLIGVSDTAGAPLASATAIRDLVSHAAGERNELPTGHADQWSRNQSV